MPSEEVLVNWTVLLGMQVAWDTAGMDTEVADSSMTGELVLDRCSVGVPIVP